MAIYDKSTKRLFFEMADELLPNKDSTIDRRSIVQWFSTKYPKIKKSTVDAHITQMSINAPSRVHHNVGPGHDLLFRLDQHRFRRFNRDHDPQPVYAASSQLTQDQPTEEVGDDDLSDVPTEFAYERDLKSFLGKNLHTVELGLSLYQSDEGITGIEYPVGGRFIDILAVDAKGIFVVIELKVSRGYDRVVGQLLNYMGWIRENLADGKDVRGMIIASSITADLRLACSRIHDVKLFEYKLAVTLQEVKQA